MSEWPGWPAEFAEHYESAGFWRGETFSRALHRWADRSRTDIAIVDGDRTRTYAELLDESLRIAGGLVAAGLHEGDRVIVQLPNRLEFVTVWFALQHVGAVPVHAMPAHRAAELRYLSELADARVFITTDVHNGFDHRGLAARLRSQTATSDSPVDLVVVVGEPGEGDVALGELLAHEPLERPAEVSSRALALLLLSGGTTGMPKLIPRTHDDYLYNAECSARRCGMHAGTVFLTPLPIAFNYAWCCPGVLSVLTAGGRIVLTRDVSPRGCLDLMERERVTSLSLNPPLTALFLEELAENRFDLSSLEVVDVGSARLADDLARAVEPAFGATLQQVFGMAEGLICYTDLTDPPALRTTTQGTPMSPADEIRIVAAGTDTPVPDGEVGELLTRGPYTLRGYLNAPEQNRIGFDADGFYRTGDLVRQLPDGHLVVIGRVKDQINRGGQKIPALEVEGHLIAHPRIEQAALVAAPDALEGESPVAVIRCSGEAPDRADIVRFLRDRGLASYKFPDRVVPIDRMPLTPVGKIDKSALAAAVR